MGRPAPRRDGSEQPRPESGDVGAARDGGRSEVRCVAGDPRLPVRAVCGRRRSRRHSRVPGRRADRRSAFSAYTIPTDAPGSDGTLEWNATTLVLVEASAAGSTGIGYSYATRATAVLIADTLAGVVEGRAAFDIGAAWRAMIVAIRNLGRPGIPSMAVADRLSVPARRRARAAGPRGRRSTPAPRTT